ncbi:MAG: 2-oxoisovalerate dehydrogenase [Candidatus Hydrogenedentes bacterium]|nr:2-oxoisovalerate dehydrogenase [Candidatus Hydrogenedentota bacterium]
MAYSNCIQEDTEVTEIVFQVEEDNVDGGWVARALGEGITTQADTLDELKTMIRDALRCHFDEESAIPSVIRLHFVRDEVISFAV